MCVASRKVVCTFACLSFSRLKESFKREWREFMSSCQVITSCLSHQFHNFSLDHNRPKGGLPLWLMIFVVNTKTGDEKRHWSNMKRSCVGPKTMGWTNTQRSPVSSSQCLFFHLVINFVPSLSSAFDISASHFKVHRDLQRAKWIKTATKARWRRMYFL